MQAYTYLLIDLACITIPFLASFYKKHAFYLQWKSFFKANSIVALFFIIWDIYFTKIGVWGFNPDYLTKIYIFNLPIEEILFFICIPYACVFTYFSICYLVKKNPFQTIEKYISYSLLLFLVVLAVLNLAKAYTSLTFILLALFLGYLMLKKVNLTYYYTSYLLIIPFFLWSNGILTGTNIQQPIVWYNNAENLGIRIGTIPLEDCFYGMLLIFMHIYGFDYFRKKRN